MTTDLSLLNDDQIRAVQHQGSHLLVVAGPGSGKTRVLTHRVAWLLDQGVSASEIVAVTFTNKAAGEIRTRLEKLAPQEAVGRLWAGTFHSLCARLLRIEHEAANLSRSFQILDSDDTERVVVHILKERGLVEDTKTAKQLARELREQISLAKNTLSAPSERYDGGLLQSVFDEYTKRLKEMQALDFDDLLLEALNLLNNGSEVAAKWCTRFAHVLVDEFQDTNKVQLAIVQALSSYGHVTAVGDAAQAIYSWRGADNTVIDRFGKEFAPAEIVLLGENYRSTPQIVATCQAILDADKDSNYSLVLRTSNPPGALVIARECDDDRDEAAWIVDKIRSSAFALQDHAILVRTAAQTRSLEEALLFRKMPYIVVGGQRFYERAEVRDALSHMRAAVFDTDVIAFSRAATTPRCGIGEKTVTETIAATRKHGSLQKALRLSESRASALHHFADHLSRVELAANKGPAEAVKAVLSAGLQTHWAAQQNGESRVENLDQLVSAAAVFETGMTADGREVAALTGFEATVAFIEYVALVSAADTGGTQSVQILTIHAAKGREFPVVFVAGVEEDLLPHIRSVNSEIAIREERRLMYVACSRAEKQLYISWARQRLLFGKPRVQSPSRFLEDLPKDQNVVSFERATNRKSPWTQNHRSRPVGTGTWVEPHTSTREKPAPSVFAPSFKPATATGPRLNPTEATVGIDVWHTSFGKGLVRVVRGDTIEIRFVDKTRTLSLSMAPLRLVP